MYILFHTLFHYDLSQDTDYSSLCTTPSLRYCTLPQPPLLPSSLQPPACVLSRFSRVRLFATLWTISPRQAPLSMGFSRQERWSGLPCPPPGDLPHPGIEPTSLKSPALADGPFTTSITWDAPSVISPNTCWCHRSDRCCPA